jgi:hypothetical protein
MKRVADERNKALHEGTACNAGTAQFAIEVENGLLLELLPKVVSPLGLKIDGTGLIFDDGVCLGANPLGSKGRGG